MPRVRRVRSLRRYRRYNRYNRTYIPRRISNKYSNETKSCSYVISNNQQIGIEGWIQITSETNIQGVRKAKNFTLTVTTTPFTQNGSTIESVHYFALVFVPEGLGAGHLNIQNTAENHSYYEPNQNVILAGVIDPRKVYVFKTRLARNLNSGDRIYYLWKQAGDGSVNPIHNIISFTINYALSF